LVLHFVVQSSMTQSEYQQLIHFLSGKFEAIEARFTRLEVGMEDLRHHVQIVAEGVTMCNERIDRNARLIQGLDERVASLEARVELLLEAA
jgi:chromosome segregation ATPase